MAVYGLRVSEVLGLSLDALDWEHDKIRVARSKSKDHLDLPLLPEVGNAILDYLQRGRPNSESKALFIIKTCQVQTIVRKYFRQLKLEPHGHATSLFRHSLAMEMVSQGIPLKNIADVLGHRHLASTYVYAKSDVEGLRAAALPAVGGALCRSN
jgi:site-specific recombinase XerD